MSERKQFIEHLSNNESVLLVTEPLADYNFLLGNNASVIFQRGDETVKITSYADGYIFYSEAPDGVRGGIHREEATVAAQTFGTNIAEQKTTINFQLQENKESI